MDDPLHLYQAVRLEALADNRLLDSVQILDDGRDACALHPDTVEDIDFEPHASIEECLGPPDAVVDAASCTPELATEISQRGQTMLLSFGGVVGPGDVIEVRDAAACDGADTPTFRVSIAVPGRLDDRHIVIGEVSGPIGRITVPEDIFE